MDKDQATETVIPARELASRRRAARSGPLGHRVPADLLPSRGRRAAALLARRRLPGDWVVCVSPD